MPREIEIVPFANNDLSADYLFSQREYYVSSSDVYQIKDNTPKPIDIWYERPYWGKVDTKFRLILLDDDFLLTVGANRIPVLNFVAEAYNEFRDYAVDAANKLRTSMTSFINVTSPVLGHQNVVLDYKDYFEDTLDDGFANIFLSEEDKSNIKSFLDYSREYLVFSEVNSTIPHTLAGYLSSPFASYRNSGLIIEFARDSYDNDEAKWSKYLSNDFFNDYTRIAANFGFYVNKHVPWSIVANLNSPVMKNYMIQYGFSKANSLFNSMFFQAEYISYISFKKYMFLSYASFIESRPKIEVIKYKNCMRETIAKSSFKTEREIFLRPTEIGYFNASYEEFTSIYSDYTFLKLYVKIRLMEENIILNKFQYEKLIYDLTMKTKKEDIFDATLHFANFLAHHRRMRFSKVLRRSDYEPTEFAFKKKTAYNSPCANGTISTS